LTRYCFDKGFIGMTGLDIELVLTTPAVHVSLFKPTALSLANHFFVLLHHSQFNNVYFDRVPLLQCTTIFTSDNAFN
ncbi:sugar phosphate isomerase family, partial [Staphylococcus aureus]